MPKHFEERIVEIKHTGTQAAGKNWSPTTPFELEADEMGELVYAEVFPPVTADGTEEPLERWYPILDDSKYDDYLALNGTRSPLMNPSALETKGNVVAFGEPIVNAVKKGAPMLEGRCPKFKSKISVETWAGGSDITADYLIRFHIWVYRKDELPLIAATVPGLGAVYDTARDRRIPVGKPPISLTYDNWDKLPGGLKQAVPTIHSFMTWASNNNATTANQPYIFRLLGNNVDPAKSWQQLYFDYENGEHILQINGIGVRTESENLKESFLNIAGDDHPKGRIPTRKFNNPILFGAMRPLVDVPFYVPIPKFVKFPYYVYREIGYVAVQDVGSSVPADNVRVCLNGIKIDLV